MAMKSASLMSSVQAALPTAESCTAPGGVDRSIVHVESGLFSLNRNVVFTFSAVAGLPCTKLPIARKMSALFGTAAAVAPAAAGAAFGLGLGSSVHSSTAAF